MSRSPQNGGFHRCTGGGPLLPARFARARRCRRARRCCLPFVRHGWPRNLRLARHAARANRDRPTHSRASRKNSVSSFGGCEESRLRDRATIRRWHDCLICRTADAPRHVMCMERRQESTRSSMMAVAGGEGLEKLEDMIVRAAETTAAHVAAAKAAIGAVIFGQEQVVEQALITVLSRRPRPAGRRARPRQDQAGRDHGHRARPRRAPHPVHARPDALRHPRHRGAGGERRRQAQLPLHRRARSSPSC